ncbi:MAG TPA: cytochrome c3 family protein, partial [Pyrinomonadaceae bacterium]|nr:cytochrome c3 family protein [Pyrinomonadaceae bacterium]
PAAEAAKHPPLATAHPADRTVTLTAETVKDAKTPEVNTCRSCHAQDGRKPKLGDEIPQITYEGESDPTILTNEEAFHRNCAGCHDAAADARKNVKAPTSQQCIGCHGGQTESGGGSSEWIETTRQRANELQAEARDRERASKQVNQAARAAQEALADYVEALTVTRVPKPDPTQAAQRVEAYGAQAVSDVLTNIKAILLQGLRGERRLEGLRAYVERVFPTPLQLSLFKSGQKTFVERNAASEVLAEAEEVIETVHISDTEVEITVICLPDDATFKLLSFNGDPVIDICTYGCSVRLFRGDYRYEVVRSGYKRKRFDLPLLNRAPRLKLGCHMVRMEEANDPPPCEEIVVSEK